MISGDASLPGTRERGTDPNAVVAARVWMVGAVAALPAEVECLAHQRVPFLRATAITPELSVIRGGVGEKGADIACRLLLEAGATALVSWGIAAGLDPALTPGTIVITAQAVTAEPDGVVTAVPTNVPSQEWADRVAARLRSRVPLSRGAIGHTNRILETIEAKRELARSGAAAADMETRAVAQVAHSAGVPWIAVRAISDGSEVSLPRGVLGAVDESGRVRAGRLVAALVRRPSELMALPRLARGFRAALRALEVAAEDFGATLLVSQLAQERVTLEVGEARAPQ